MKLLIIKEHDDYQLTNEGEFVRLIPGYYIVCSEDHYHYFLDRCYFRKDDGVLVRQFPKKLENYYSKGVNSFHKSVFNKNYFYTKEVPNVTV